MPIKKIQLLLLLIIIARPIFSQGNDAFIGSDGGVNNKNSLFKILNKISINFSVGYGRAFYSHRIENSGLILNPALSDSGLYLFSLNNLNYNQPIPAIRNWMNNPSTSMIKLDENLDKNQMILIDSTRFSFRGNSASYPLTLTLHYDFLKRFRVGGGLTVEFHRLPIMSPSIGEDMIGKYIPNTRNTVFLRYFGMVGAKVYQWMNWSYYMDLQFGKLKLGNAFQKPSITQRFYYNLGVPIEYEFSEYLKAVIRPSFEYNINNLRTNTIGGSSIQKVFSAFYLNIGFRYNFPEIPRCPLKASSPSGYDYPEKFTNKSCRIQRKHFHGDLAFRGQPFYKHQNPEIGENYPSLVKYRFFNKRKMSAGY